MAEETTDKRQVPQDELDVVALVDERFKQAQDSRQGFDSLWYICANFLISNQWISFNPASRTVEDLTRGSGKRRAWQLYPVHNIILPRVRKALGKLLGIRPKPVGAPSSNEQEDKDSAHIATRLLDYLWTELNIDKAMRRAATWLLTTGNVIFKVYWDNQVGTDVPVAVKDELGNAVRDEDGRPVTEARHMGQVGVGVVSPFEFYTDPNVLEWDDMRWWIHAFQQPISALKEAYGERAEGLGTDQAKNEAGPYSMSRLSTTVGTQTGLQGASPRESEVVLVKECWEKPTPKHPKGRFTVTAGGQILVPPQDWPHGITDNPFIKAEYFPVPWRMWGVGLVELLLRPQKEQNLVLKRILEHMQVFASGKWVVDKTAGISRQAIDNTPGEIIQKNPGSTVSYTTPPTMPGHYHGLRQYVREDANDIAGQHEVSQGQTPPGVRAGVAIRFLQEADNEQLAICLQELNDAITQIGRKMLIRAADNYLEERTVEIVGKDRKREVVTFNQADLRTAVDVQLETSAAYPESREGRRQAILEDFQLGLFGNPGDAATRKAVRKMLNYGPDIEEALQDDQEERDEGITGLVGGQRNAGALEEMLAGGMGQQMQGGLPPTLEQMIAQQSQPQVPTAPGTEEVGY